MARSDRILDELGLGPVWVSRVAGTPANVLGDLSVARAAPVPRDSAPVKPSSAIMTASVPADAPHRAPAVEAIAPDALATNMPAGGRVAPIEAPGHTPIVLPPVEQLDWPALAERVSQCTSCKLCEKRTQTVFGVGDPNADWMLIGEAPGETEDKQGEPFVGQAGKLLDNMLRSLGMQRGQDVYIANVIKCRPPNNRNPEPEEVARCEPYLQRQVALVQPKLIVAMGRFAAQSLLKTTASIASLRGRLHEYQNVPVIVTYHPAYLLRSLPDKAKAWSDLCMAKATYEKLRG
ncbi:uracil-DNA glycosylase family protein [Burkholderia sp. L27(2015)]|uniref:uracil-DNA glycosylase n=1 Tax=Burkholderia sp. L27(2015) TaxID=1641858 RepID=UPI00131DEB0F|nr:uracil-DNA glycosylase [Burkholderia sp. L27(2015)]